MTSPLYNYPSSTYRPSATPCHSTHYSTTVSITQSHLCWSILSSISVPLQEFKAHCFRCLTAKMHTPPTESQLAVERREEIARETRGQFTPSPVQNAYWARFEGEAKARRAVDAATSDSNTNENDGGVNSVDISSKRKFGSPLSVSGVSEGTAGLCPWRPPPAHPVNRRSRVLPPQWVMCALPSHMWQPRSIPKRSGAHRAPSHHSRR